MLLVVMVVLIEASDHEYGLDEVVVGFTGLLEVVVVVLIETSPQKVLPGSYEVVVDLTVLLVVVLKVASFHVGSTTTVVVVVVVVVVNEASSQV